MVAISQQIPDVVVIGAGITGLAAALELAEFGVSVEVIETYRPAAMASGWTLAGVRQSGRDLAELPLALSAVKQWSGLSTKLGKDTEYRQEGNLRLARTEAEADSLKQMCRTQEDAGLPISYLTDLVDIRKIAPPLSNSVMAATFCPSDGHANPIATAEGYTKSCESLGVRFSFGEGVKSLEAFGGQLVAVKTNKRKVSCGAVLAAPGILVNTLLDPFGISIPLRRPMVTVLRSAPIAPILKPVLGVANADLAVRQEVSGRLRVTSGAEDWDGQVEHRNDMPVIHPRARSVRATIEKVANVLPAFSEVEIEQIWAGALDLTPDALPVIDKVPGLSNLVVAAGFSGHGFGIGPVTGPLAAQLLAGREPEHCLAAFSFDRFNQTDLADVPLTLHG
ncbi:FAD-binding oxidoreductase [Labrenzia sp. CE80]|uniref:NAD(P)/FAD-dependent oxidoreductase n=1 Tax=Labrenzia sp. CE80 TaxID=1788986 RepID=UPI00129A6E10|nr:FAD-binding oxidoreductase [Labrenzia sp. CE80]